MVAALPSWFGSLAADLAVVAAVIVAVGVIHRGLIRPVLCYARRLEATVADVRGEFRNNGGTTMRDAIDRIDTRTSSLEEWRESVDTRLTPTPEPTPEPKPKPARPPRKKAV
jgi:hypothetical protein